MTHQTNVTVRYAAFEDAGAIARVHTDAWRDTYSELLPEELIDGASYGRRLSFRRDSLSADRPSFSTLVAEQNGQIIGFADFGPKRDREMAFDGECYALYVSASKKRQGVGRVLFLKGINTLIDMGFSSAYAWGSMYLTKQIPG